MAKKLSLSEAQLAASGKLPQQQDVMGDAPKGAVKISKKTQAIINDVEAIQDYVDKELTSPEEVEQAISQIVTTEAAKVAPPKRQYPLARAANKRAAKSEVVKTKADTIDAEDKKTIAGKAQILDAAKVMEIIQMADGGAKPSVIAKLYGVAPSHVSNIIRGVTWQHVTGRHYVKGAYKKAAKQAPAAKETAAKKPATIGEKATGTKKGGK